MSSTTNSYNYTDFNPGIPEATIVGSYSNYTNGGNLVINVTVHVNTTHKQYELYGDLFDNTSTTYITNAKNTTYYNETDIDEFGNLVVPLVFDGSEITASGVAVPYKLAYLRLSIYNEEDHYWEELEVKINPYYTQGGS